MSGTFESAFSSVLIKRTMSCTNKKAGKKCTEISVCRLQILAAIVPGVNQISNKKVSLLHHSNVYPVRYMVVLAYKSSLTASLTLPVTEVDSVETRVVETKAATREKIKSKDVEDASKMGGYLIYPKVLREDVLLHS